MAMTWQGAVLLAAGLSALDLRLRLCLRGAEATAQAQFLPFGTSVGDTSVPRGDDTSSGRIDLSVGIPIFGSVFAECWVNVNGIISFRQGFSTYTPTTFPLSTSIPLVAPFWADVNIAQAGRIFYRQAMDSQTLQAAQNLLDESSTAHQNFQVEMVFIVTWDEVPGYGGSLWRHNSFQCLLMTDGIRTLAVFLYGNIVWTTGTASGGNSVGLGGTPAQVGFDAGDGIRFHVTPESRTAAVVNLETLSNVGRPGVYIYRIDGSDFGTGQRCGASSMGVSPHYDGPLGGELLTVVVGEECFSDQENLALVFEIESYRQVVPAVIVDATHLRCLAPPSGRVGRSKLSLSFDGGNSTNVSTSFFYVNSVRPVARLETDGDPQGQSDIVLDLGVDGQVVNITWDPAGFEAENLDIFALPVWRDSEMDTVEVIAEGVPNTGRFELSSANFTDDWSNGTELVPLQFILTPSAEEGERRLVAPLFGIGVRIGMFIKDLARLGRVYKAVRGLYKAVKFVERWGKEFFDWFLDHDFSQLPPVPCFEWVAALSTDWTVDYHCSSPENCGSHPGSHICYRQTTPNADGSSHQVCYKADGDINMSPEGAGTADKAWTPGAPWWSLGAFWPTLKHLYWDGLPFKLLTLMYGEEGLELYRKHRPPPSKDNCFTQLPVPAAALGDPHITTLDGLSYTFNGAGEFWFLRVENGLLDIQVRMEQVPRGSATIITSLALKTQTGPAVQIGLGSTGLLQVLVDGEVQSFDNVLTEQSYDGGITVAFKNSVTAPAARVVVAGLIVVTVNVASSALSLVTQAFPVLNNMTSGLLGVFDGDTENDLTSLNGTTLPSDATAYQIHYSFGMTWMVNSAQESLFSYRGSQTFAGFRNVSFQPVLMQITDFNTSEVEICGSNFACLFDLHVTEDPVFAAATVTQLDEFREVVEVIEEARVMLLAVNTTTSTMTNTSTTTTSTSSSSTTSSTSSTTTSSTTTNTTTTTTSSSTTNSTTITTTTTSSSTATSSTSTTSTLTLSSTTTITTITTMTTTSSSTLTSTSSLTSATTTNTTTGTTTTQSTVTWTSTRTSSTTTMTVTSRALTTATTTATPWVAAEMEDDMSCALRGCLTWVLLALPCLAVAGL